VASATWKAIERTVALLVGGERTWNSPEHIDVEVDGWAIECKNVTAPSIAQVEGWLRHNRPKAESKGLKSALVVKRRAGKGTPTPYLAIFELTEPTVN
jgi:hypothetical protein